MIRTTYRGTVKDSETEGIITNAELIRIRNETRAESAKMEAEIRRIGLAEYGKQFQ